MEIHIVAVVFNMNVRRSNSDGESTFNNTRQIYSMSDNVTVTEWLYSTTQRTDGEILAAMDRSRSALNSK